MADYIKREDAIAYVVSLVDRFYDGTIAPRDIIKEAKQQVINEMNSTDILPAADVRENVHGKWVERHVNVATPETDIFCSICGWPAWNQHSNFCPNCGADMRGE